MAESTEQVIEDVARDFVSEVQANAKVIGLNEERGRIEELIRRHYFQGMLSAEDTLIEVFRTVEEREPVPHRWYQ